MRVRIPLTRFRLNINGPDGKTRSVRVVDLEPVPHADSMARMPLRRLQPRVAWCLPISDEDGAIGTVVVEYASSASLADDEELRAEIERVARTYAPALRACVRGDRAWPGVRKRTERQAVASSRREGRRQ